MSRGELVSEMGFFFPSMGGYETRSVKGGVAKADRMSEATMLPLMISLVFFA